MLSYNEVEVIRVIEINGITKSYNGKVNAVDDISLEIRDGEIFGFLGPNGAGKTTTIKMITGIIEATKGEILINGLSLKDKPLEYKKSFGYVPDNPDMFLRMKGIEYLNFMADIYDVPSKERSVKIDELSKRFSMENALGDKLQSYSHGMRQKIILMGALLHNPEVWILDEPMTGLDPKSSFILKEMMKEHAESGKNVFFSTHVLEVAEKLCDRVAIINKGKILFCGTLDEIKDKFAVDESLEKMFLEMTENE
nr:ABC transporter ATP-binding protein [Clostridium sp. YIM B02551]